MLKHNRLILSLTVLSLSAASSAVFAVDSIYCPQKSGYARVGMSMEEVLSICGDPAVKQTSDTFATQKVRVQQYIFDQHNKSKAFYGVWALPIGDSNYSEADFNGTSSGGVSLEITAYQDKVLSISYNGQSVQGFDTCGGDIKIGTDMGEVYSLCGDPSQQNNTYINIPIQSKSRPQIWTYQPDYQPSVRMTFIDGKLFSIE
jgi:hypothetical protein